MRRRYLLYIFYIAAWACGMTMLTACSDDSSDLYDGDGAVTFTASLDDLADTRAGLWDEMTTDRLKEYDAYTGSGGFGVFAYYTGNTPWNTAGSTTTPNFMYNLQVYWDSYTAKNWVYSPQKYWPNENQPADDEGATGVNNAHSYVSFFAYAPYVDPTLDLGTDGITALSANTAAGAPTVTYTLSDVPEQQVDLLWGTRGKTSYAQASGETNVADLSAGNVVNTDLTKQTTTERVSFAFKHAMASIDVYVQRIYDEISPSGKKPDTDAAKIFVSQLKLTVPADKFCQQGVLDLATGKWSGTELGTQKELFVDAAHMDANLMGTMQPNTNLTAVQNVELDNFDSKTGCDENLRRLTALPYATMLIPRNGNTGIPVTPTLTYSFVTKDPSLVLDIPNSTGTANFSRITHEVTGAQVIIGTETSTGNYKLLPGYRYILVCYIGVESVQFQVISIEDWDFPMRFTPSIDAFKDVDYKKGTQTPSEWQGKTVNE